MPAGDFEKLLVAFVCAVFSDFLKIHPYANGNGHAARFIAWALLGRYRLWPTTWPIHPRMPDPGYTQMLRDYRTGNKSALEQCLLSAFRPPAPVAPSAG